MGIDWGGISRLMGGLAESLGAAVDVEHEPYQNRDPSGRFDVYGPPVVRKAVVTAKGDARRTRGDGTSVTYSHKLTFTQDFPLDVKDRIRFGGRAYRIVDFEQQLFRGGATPPVVYVGHER